MQSTKLMWVVIVLAGGAAAGAVVCAMHTRSELSDAQERIDRLERDLKAVGGTKAKGLADDVEKLHDQVADLAKSVQTAHDAASHAEKQTTDLQATTQKSIDSLQKQVASSGGPSGTGVDAAALEEIVSKKVQEKVGQGTPNPDQKRKPPLADLSKELGLSAAQEDQVAEVVNAGKKRIAELLQIKRSDGTCMLDEVVTAMKDPPTAEQKMKELFARLFTEPIPGRSEAYIQEVLRIQGDVKRGLQANMNADQYKQFERSNIDVTDIQTGYDPFAEYVASHPR